MLQVKLLYPLFMNKNKFQPWQANVFGALMREWSTKWLIAERGPYFSEYDEFSKLEAVQM